MPKYLIVILFSSAAAFAQQSTTWESPQTSPKGGAAV